MEGWMKRLTLTLAVLLILAIPTVNAATISPSSFSLSLKEGQSETKLINISVNNETCNLQLTGDTEYFNIYGLPNSISGTGTITNIPITIQAKTGSPSGSYSLGISYCDASLDVSVNINQTGACKIIFNILGSKEPGKTMAFELLDCDYYPKDGNIYVTRSDGTTERIECSGGFCTWVIPPTEEGPLIVRAVVPGYAPVTRQVTLTTPANITQNVGGSLMITAPTSIAPNENFQILITSKNGPEPFVQVQVIGPEGYTFTGMTDNYGIVRDSSQKIFGVGIKLDKEGIYNVFAKKEGYEPANFVITVERKDCPYECCLPGTYKEKACPTGYECKQKDDGSYYCSKIELPEIDIVCRPEKPVAGDRVTCSIYDENGNKLNLSGEGRVITDDEEIAINFNDGVASFTYSKPTEFEVKFKPEGYEEGVYRGEIYPAKVPIWLFITVGGILVFILFFVWTLGRKKRKETVTKLEM